LVLLTSCGQGSGSRAVTSATGVPAPSPVGTTPGVGVPSRVALIVMENHDFDGIVGAEAAPYINRTLIPSSALFTNYYAVSHPSLPNYLAMTSGSTHAKDGTDSISPGEIPGDNLFDQLTTAGLDWRAFEETIPSVCDRSITAGGIPGLYALKHDPAMAYADVAETSLCQNVVPLSDLNPFELPAFSFITPNECSDMHSCSVSQGDAWLQTNVPPLQRSGATVIVTFDEGSSDVGGGGHVLTLEVGPQMNEGATNDLAFSHYSLLAGLEQHFGLPLLGRARGSRPLPVR
jgi:hypothetical protein